MPFFSCLGESSVVPPADRRITSEVQGGDGSESEARETDQEESFNVCTVQCGIKF